MSALPQGVLVAWYGDDFTGAASVMEALTFAGLPSVLFLEAPTPERLARFPGCRGVGIAGAARSQGPAWMDAELPPAFAALARIGAPITQYKLCSTFDSAPQVGSIGRAIELALPILGGEWVPLLTASPANGRYQAFGNLFAAMDGTAHRLDRHPVMARHPVTPIDEADLGRHLARQTSLPIGLVDLVALRSGRADVALDALLAEGKRIVSLDVMDDETLREAGRLLWERRGQHLFVAGSQGVEYALIAYWRACGLLARAGESAGADAGPARVAAVSGSCSPVTARQIDWAEAHGFAPIRLDPCAALDPAAWGRETGRAGAEALRALSEGRDPLIFTARGPDDPAVGAFRQAVGGDEGSANARLGEGLGRVLNRVLLEAGLRRGIIAGGDTSSHAALALDVFALTALAPVATGAALCTAHSDDPDRPEFELALKGGQMGGDDYFGRVRAGGANEGKGSL